MTKIFIIRGKYTGQPWEDIDEFPTLEEARKMMREYQIAFGSGWSLTIKRTRVAA